MLDQIKLYNYVLSILFVSLILNSCQTKNEHLVEKKSKISAQEIIIRKSWESTGKITQTITLDSKGIFRGLNFGIPITSIKEKIDLAENQPPNGKSYTLYFDASDLNFADVTYYADKENKLAQIDIDIFVEQASQVKKIITDFTNYFNAKFGQVGTRGKILLWVQNKKARVSLEDVSTFKDPGIKITFRQVN